MKIVTLTVFASASWILVAALSWTNDKIVAQEEPPHALRPVPSENKTPELALLMAELQRLTHKMALSAHEGNAELAAFYMHESIEQLTNIQEQTPIYEDQAIALMIERIARPAYEPFQQAVKERPIDRERMMGALDQIITSCNQCHIATKHPYLQITRGTEVNPFNQSFKPSAP
jgi:hypothetical protein